MTLDLRPLAGPLAALLLPLLAGCSSDATDSTADLGDACGDIDGPGTDTGDVPNVAGSWTSQFATNYYDDDCTAANLSATSETWIGAFTVSGAVPDAVYVYWGPRDNPTSERFWGAMDPRGGLSFSGLRDHPAGTLHTQFGGLVYDDPVAGRTVIRGSAFLGLDADGDGLIDCSARGSWNAFKSG
jgi:hypothetical protein